MTCWMLSARAKMQCLVPWYGGLQIDRTENITCLQPFHFELFPQLLSKDTIHIIALPHYYRIQCKMNIAVRHAYALQGLRGFRIVLGGTLLPLLKSGNKATNRTLLSSRPVVSLP